MQSPKKETSTKRQRLVSRSPSPSGSLSTNWTDSPRKKKSAAGDEPNQRSQRNIPAFLNKLYSMVDDNSTNDLIRWSDDGKSFIVEQQKAFSKTVLPRFYKHNTFSSFVRQLNMYDFHKVPHIQQGVLVADSDHEPWEFSHPNFQRNRHDLLYLVVRKRIRNNTDAQLQQKQQYAPSGLQNAQQLLLQQQQQQQQLSSSLLQQNMAATGGLGGGLRLDALNSSTCTQLEHVRLGSLVKDISTIRDHQHAISTDLQHLHNDNEILWRESLLAREKHQRHQQVIERILLFLTTVFSNDTANTTKHASSYVAEKQNELLGGSTQSTGSSNSIVNPPNKLIEEAVKLAGISTASLQEKYLDQNGATNVQPSALGSQQQQTLTTQLDPSLATNQSPVHQQSTENIQNQSTQDKEKSGMRGGVSGTETSFLFRALNDLYSIRDTSFTSHPPGMNSSAMEPSLFSRAGPSSSSPTGYHSFQQQQQQSAIEHVGTSGNDSGDLPVTNVNDPILGSGRMITSTIGTMDTTTMISEPGTTTSTANHTNDFGGFSPFGELSSITGDQSNIGGGDITRITGLAQSIHTATRSAEAISQDIDDLQISIESLAATMGLDANGMEGFDGYMEEFTDNYSNMISMATRNDKRELFNLAADSNYSTDQHAYQLKEEDPCSTMLPRSSSSQSQ